MSEGVLPDITAKFISDTRNMVAGINRMVTALGGLRDLLTEVDGQLAGFQATVDAAAEAVSASAGAVTEAAGAQTEMAAAETEATDAAAAQRDVLATVAEIQAKVAESAGLAADGMRTQAGAADEAAVAAKGAGDAQLVMRDKTAAASEESAGFSLGMDGLGSSLSKSMGILKTGGEVVLGYSAAIGYSLDKASKFTTELTRLQTAAGLTDQILKKNHTTMQGVGDQLKKLGDQYGQTGTAMAQAMYHPISTGLDLKTSLLLVAQAANLAQIHGANLEDTTYALSSVMKAYNQQAKDVTKTSALLNAIVGEGDMRFQDFNTSVKNWAPSGEAMGISIQSLGSAIAYLTDRGNSAEVASTRLTMGLSMMTSGSKQANAYLHDLGLTADTVTMKNKNLADAMTKAGLTTNKLAADLKKPDGVYVALSDLKNALIKAGASASDADSVMSKIFGGGRSDKAIMSLMGNLDGLKQKYSDIGKAVSTYGDKSAQAAKTPEATWKQLKATLDNVIISFGQTMLPAAQKIGGSLAHAFQGPEIQKGLGQLGDATAKVMTALAPLMPVIVDLAAQLASTLAPALEPIAKALLPIFEMGAKELAGLLRELTPYLPPIIKAIGAWLQSQMALAPAMLKLVGALLPLIPALADLAIMSAQVSTVLAELAGAIIEILAPPLKLLAELVSWVVKEIFNFFKWLYDELVGHSIIPDMVNAIATWWHHMVTDAENILSWFEGLPGKFWKWMTDTAARVGDGVGKIVSWYLGLPGKILHALGDLGSLLINAGEALIQGLEHGIDNALGGLYNKISGIAGAISNLKGPIDKDKVLLVPHGQAIIDGLAQGIDNRLPALYDKVKGIGDGIKKGVGDSAGLNGWTPNMAWKPLPLPASTPWSAQPTFGPTPAGVGYGSGVGAMAYGGQGGYVDNRTIVQVQGSVISDRDLTRLVQKALTGVSKINSTNGAAVPAGRTG